MKTCAQCIKPFKPKHPSQKFCSHKGSGNCKDRFHNAADPSRLARVAKPPRQIVVSDDDDDEGPSDSLYWDDKDCD